MISIHLMLLFINMNLITVVNQLYFNTSHVTVYRSLYSSILFLFTDFNTSHVTVYQLVIADVGALEIFQYISCYCLSNELTPFYIFLRI